MTQPGVENEGGISTNQQPLEWAHRAAQIADNKKGLDIVVLDMQSVTLVADYFVIISGMNTIQVNTIADTIEEEFALEEGISLLQRVGRGTAQWVLLDFGAVVIHVFTEDQRKYYDLERLWGDAEVVRVLV